MSGLDDPLEGLLGAVRRRPARDTPAPETDSVPAPPGVEPAAGPLPLPSRRGVGDPLDALLGAAPARAGRRDGAPADGARPGAGGRGLNPLDLLALPPDQQRLVNWLSRKKQATFAEIQQALEAEIGPLEPVLAALEAAGYLHPALLDGTVYYRVVFAGRQAQAGRGLPAQIWARMDLDNATFLRQVPLFSRLADEERQVVAALLKERHYQRNEVILWQGERNDHVFFLKAGVVGISRLSPQSQDSQVLAYLKEGDMLGEYGVLGDQGQTASATVTALSEVDVLVMTGEDFYTLLQRYSAVSIELSRMLTDRLRVSNERATGGDAQICLLVGVRPGMGGTTLGSALALTLAQATGKPAVYTEYPDGRRLAATFGVPPETEVYTHPGGFDVYLPRPATGLPPVVRTTLLLDQLVSSYAHIVIGLPGKIDAATPYLLERAGQVVILTVPDADVWAQAGEVSATLRASIRPEKTGICVVNVRPAPEYQDAPLPGPADFDIPFLPALPPPERLGVEPLPPALTAITTPLADRLGRTNQISVYIPTTVEVDVRLDTGPYVERTLAFLGALFGGATSNQAQGVWNSREAGLVNETIHIVRSYVTQADMDRLLPAVLEYVEQIKLELKQEAMALEVNQKLLIV